MVKRSEDYASLVKRLFGKGSDSTAICRDITFQITDGCNLCCAYCYEHHKGQKRMTLETGKKIVDRLMDAYEDGTGDFINRQTKALVLNFIGGEPLLEAALIEHICDYYFSECWRRSIPLAPFTRISFATNGVNWFSSEAQHLIKKYCNLMSVTISIDGVPELHDKYRIDPQGAGSFSRAWAAFQDAKRFGWRNSKMTFVQDSFPYIADSIKLMISEGCKEIHCNYAYEPEYTADDARALYGQLKQVADYLIEHAPDVSVSILDELIGNPTVEDHNYCGGTGAMISFAPDGKAYPCIRYAPISVGEEKAASMVLGDAEHGLYTTEAQRKKKAELDAITLSSQSPEKCLVCPVASGCGWCSGLNYELFGTPNKRSTNICLAHKARVLAACYYINRRSVALGDCRPKRVNLPADEARELVGVEWADEIYTLEQEAFDFQKGNLK